MQRIDSATKGADLFGPGKHGFIPGDPLAAILATRFNANWCNAVQEEIARVIEATGAELDPNSYDQLLTAIQALIAAGAASTAGAGIAVDGKTVSLDASYLRGFIGGLGTANGVGDLANDVTIAPGVCVDTTSVMLLKRATSMTKRLDAAWAAGDGNGGLFSGVKAASTCYHLFLIRKDSDGSIDAGWDTDFNAANRPAGYTHYRRIWSNITDSTASIRRYVQSGNRAVWFSPIEDFDGATGTAAALAALTQSVPIGIKAVIEYAALNTQTNGAMTYVSDPDTADLAPSQDPINITFGSGASNTPTGVFAVSTNTSAQIRHRSQVANSVRISVQAYTDHRGSIG